MSSTVSGPKGRARGRVAENADIRRPGQFITCQSVPSRNKIAEAPQLDENEFKVISSRRLKSRQVGCQDRSPGTAQDIEENLHRTMQALELRSPVPSQEQCDTTEFLSTANPVHTPYSGGTRGRGGRGGGRGGGGRRCPRRPDGTEDNIATRPENVTSKTGLAGVPINLLANYFKLTSITQFMLYQHRVDFAPEEERTAVKIRMMQAHKSKLGGFIFDGTVLFTAVKFDKDPLELISVRPIDNSKVRITIRLVSTLTTGDHQYCQFFNIIVRRCMEYLNLQLVGRHYFDARSSSPIRDLKLELWPGYITSIRQHEEHILMCTEITHKVMRQDTAFHQLQRILEKNAANYKDEYKKAIMGNIVLTDYNNKTYRVDDVDYFKTPCSTFSKDGNDITYKDYYRQRYGINIRESNQPLLVSLPKQRDRRRGATDNIYLVPELCRMTGITPDMRNNFQTMKKLADHTRLSPLQRKEALDRFQASLTSNMQIKEELGKWSLGLSKDLLKVKGRILPREKIIFGRSLKMEPDGCNDWTKHLKSTTLLVTPVLHTWAVIHPKTMTRQTEAFISTINKSAVGMNFSIKHPMISEVKDESTASFVEAVDKLISTAHQQLIMIVLPNKRLERYSAIKKRCCIDRGVPTQAVLSKSLESRNLMAIASKIAVQILCKIGGAPWSVEIPLQDLMVVGFDVYHDTSNRGMSIGALVASLDHSLSRYFSAVSCQKTGEELSNELCINMCKALRKYEAINKRLPQRIVIYRDGVGEGQIPYVFQHEVELLKSRLKSVYRDCPVKMAFIIVTKRINTRLFTESPKLDNPPPGLVVDDYITLPQRYDFFLVSQSVRQGTVSPTSYNVISDNLGLNPDKLQRLTYKLTHLYFNWSGTVRVPAPVQYAHKLAFLVGQSLHKIPNGVLDEYLYYL